ncbi:SIR2 family protein [Acidithiobacillus ferridurans]|uniref:SIR2 family protein n=1 Tax=Acidithiobacillus ferridurans TaxID=1232575 RepID=UPI000DE54B97|nr:SIR2 family protein [Acidithiobacillus ferridurans]RBM03660.1 SIR2 family protein [Acidithiobacillus ferridurans]
MNAVDDGYLQQLDEFLSRPNQMWLLGAGVSLDAGIPLMNSLTHRVMELEDSSAHKPLLDALLAELPEHANIEHLLSQLGDYTTLGNRSSSCKVSIAGIEYTVETLEAAHTEILKHISDTVRWGYRAADGASPPVLGSYDNPMVSVQHHVAFVNALIGKRQAGLDSRRPPIRFFTTNYDTLLEDALALGCYSCWDGFSGGAVAFRNHRYGEDEPTTDCRAHVIKLHGSIDWYLGDDGKVWRVRDRDLYPVRTGRVLIYPQATKYLATQRDPFAAQFDVFRRALSNGSDNLLAICGYSFGDDHINQEIQFALSAPTSKTTILAFCREVNGIPPVLEEWRRSPWGKRVYVMTQCGLYAGTVGPLYGRTDESPLDWWTFSGVTNVLQNGAEGSV